MATIKSHTDLPQSEALSKILPLDSADTIWDLTNSDLPTVRAIPYEDSDYNNKYLNIIAAWSLAALRNLLPPAIKPNKDSYLFESHNTFDNSWVYRYYNEDGASYLYCKNTNEVDACVAMIEKLHEQKLL